MMDAEAMQSSWFLGGRRTAEIRGYTVHPDSLPTGHTYTCMYVLFGLQNWPVFGLTKESRLETLKRSLGPPLIL